MHLVVFVLILVLLVFVFLNVCLAEFGGLADVFGDVTLVAIFG